MDNKSKGGLQVPNFKLYQETILLSWLKDWILQENEKPLNLEGFNSKFGWHAYLFHEKHKVDRLFTHHFVRKNIL